MSRILLVIRCRPKCIYIVPLLTHSVSNDLEIWVKGGSRWLKMAPIDRSYTTYYWSVVVRISLSITLSSYWMLKNRDLVIHYKLWVTQGHWKWYHSKASVRFPIYIDSNYGTIFSRLDTIHERDRYSAGQTDAARQQRTRLCLASRGKNFQVPVKSYLSRLVPKSTRIHDLFATLTPTIT